MAEVERGRKFEVKPSAAVIRLMKELEQPNGLQRRDLVVHEDDNDNVQIGYGHLLLTKQQAESGRTVPETIRIVGEDVPISRRNPITRTQAEALFQQDVQRRGAKRLEEAFADKTEGLLPGVVPTQSQIDALTMFVFNADIRRGNGRLWTGLRRFNEGEPWLSSVVPALRLIRNSGRDRQGRLILAPGLVKRREMEAAIGMGANPIAVKRRFEEVNTALRDLGFRGPRLRAEIARREANKLIGPTIGQWPATTSTVGGISGPIPTDFSTPLSTNVQPPEPQESSTKQKPITTEDPEPLPDPIVPERIPFGPVAGLPPLGGTMPSDLAPAPSPRVLSRRRIRQLGESTIARNPTQIPLVGGGVGNTVIDLPPVARRARRKALRELGENTLP